MRVDRRAIAVLLAFVLVPLVVAAVLLGSPGGFAFAARLIASIRAVSREWWAVPLFIALYSAFSLFLLPLAPLSAAAALAWGWKLGGAIELLAVTVAALAPYQIARRGLSQRVTSFLARRGVTAPVLADDRFMLFIFRLIPIVPFVALNYLAGLARFRWRDYIVTTFAGSIPSIFLFAWFVDTIGAAATGAATYFRVLAACAAVALAAIIARMAARRIGRIAPPPDDGDPRSASTAPPRE